jgi:hypothetical protein
MSKRFVEIVSYELHETTCESDNTLLHLPRLCCRGQSAECRNDRLINTTSGIHNTTQ